MRSFLVSLVLAAALGYGAHWVLDTKVQQTAENAFATSGVRL